MKRLQKTAENSTAAEPCIAPGREWKPPSAARILAVAAGLAQWSTQESAWMAMNPHWVEHELRLRSALKEHKHADCIEGDPAVRG